jgi:hypothetical protein
MDQRECMFTPRVVVVAAGGRIDFLNSDRLLHNLHSTPNANPPFNRTQPKGRTIPITFPHPEIVRVSCDLHSWMRGWVVVADHPFYAITDAEGQFALKGLPPGRYTARVWQERLGTMSREIVVGTQDPTVVTLEMTARRWWRGCSPRRSAPSCGPWRGCARPSTSSCSPPSSSSPSSSSRWAR